MKILMTAVGTLVALTMMAGISQAEPESGWIPPLELVTRDKGEMAFDGCRPKPEVIEPVMCVYGDPESDHTVALIGDSHAMQWGPPLIQLADRRGWRLVTFLRAGCPVADVTFQKNCDAWRDLAIAELEAQRPGHVIVSTSIARRYSLSVRGQLLSRRASEAKLAKGMTRTLRRLSGMRSLVRKGPRVRLIRDQVTAPFVPPRCLANNPDRPRVCRFPRKRKFGPGFDVTGATRAGILPAIDPLEALCATHWCYSSRGNLVIYRDSDHLSATFARSLTDWLGARIGF